jgi:hypothetical protein
MIEYPGNWPSNTQKDAKYSVVHDVGRWAVRLLFRMNRREEALLTTREHPQLIQMVLGAKPSGGIFYINEFHHVLVPINRVFYWIGRYDRQLEFRLKSKSVGPVPDGVAVGELWPGPHVGIPYTLSPRQPIDIYFEKIREEDGTRIKRRTMLSDHVGQAAASSLSRRLMGTKGYGGGGIYINEERHFFAPVADRDYEYVYLGTLLDDPWFNEPVR